MMRSLLASALKDKLTEPCALALSGGTDSLCLFFSLLDLGLPFVAYTYTVEGYDSPDLERAVRVTDHYGIRLAVAYIPSKLEPVLADLRALMAAGVRGKVRLQCMEGHMHIAPLVRERVMVNGSGVDGLYGSYKQFAFDGSHRDKAIFDARRATHLANPNDDAMEDQTSWYRRFGVETIFPYRSEGVIGYLMGKSYAELMRPRYKVDTVADYPEFQAFDHLYRPRGSQQIMAGTRALHDRLLLSSPYNRGHKRVEEIYKDIEKGLV